jgi:hypothetical protein
MWDVDNGSKLREFPGHKLPIDSMTFSPDGILLASGSRDSNIKLWNVENGDEVATLTANAIPRWVLFNKEGDKLIAFNDNETIEVWDVLTHKRLALLDKKSPDTKPRLNELVSEVKIDDKALLDAKYQLKPDENGNTHLVDRFSKEVIGTLYRLNRDWVITTPTGRFDTNKPLNRVVNGLHWIISDQPLKPLPLDVFIRQYYEPSLLPRVLKCREEKSCDEEFKRLPPITELNRVQPKVAITEIKPAADGNDLLDITVDVENVTEDIEISAKDTTKKKRISSGVFDLRLFREGQLVGNSTPKQNLESFINDAPRFVEEDRIKKTLAPTSEDIAWRAANDLSNVTTFGKDGKAVYVFKNVKIPQNGKKEIKFSAYAFNSDRVKSNTAETVFKNETPKTRKGKTYLITIGVDASENPERHLYQSGKVALKFQEELGTRLMQSPENIVGVTLISKYKSDKNSELAENNATKLKIKALFSLLGGSDSADDRKILTGVANVEKMEPVQPEDELIILFSGHGDRDSNGFFYLLPYDIGSNPAAPNARRKLISSDELSLWLRDINAREIIFIIDSCKSAASVESGGFKPGPMGSRGLGQLAYDKGMKVLAAAQSFNSAWQQCALGQSILSYALLQNGLIEGKADTLLPKQRLTATEWLSYAEERVPELHLEVINGKYGTSCSQSQGPISDRLQTPKLFDFTTNESADPLIQLR